jgi:hypothetical protein
MSNEVLQKSADIDTPPIKDSETRKTLFLEIAKSVTEEGITANFIRITIGTQQEISEFLDKNDIDKVAPDPGNRIEAMNMSFPLFSENYGSIPSQSMTFFHKKHDSTPLYLHDLLNKAPRP